MPQVTTHTHFDFSDLNPKERYKLLSGTVIPRPIALITTLSKDGRRNAGSFCFFNVLTHDPAIVAIGVENYEDGRMKDTSRNIRDPPSTLDVRTARLLSALKERLRRGLLT